MSPDTQYLLRKRPKVSATKSILSTFLRWKRSGFSALKFFGVFRHFEMNSQVYTTSPEVQISEPKRISKKCSIKRIERERKCYRVFVQQTSK